MASQQGHIEPGRLEESLRHLHVRHDEAPLDDALEQVLDAARILFHATGTGLMAIDAERVLRYVAATDEPARMLEEAQDEVGEGPCVDALVYDELVQTRDFREDDRWPALKPKVPEQVRAILGVPVHVFGEPVGSLDAYLDEPYEWDESDVRALDAYSGLIGSLLASALEARERSEVIKQLQHALDNRVIIERAVGMLMGRDGIDAVAAFNRLRRAARDRRIRVAELAERVLAGEPLDAK